MSTLSKPITKMPLIVAGPWTLHARADAARKDVQLAMQGYFTDAMQKRNWSPYADLPIAEMRERGHMLSDATVTMIQGYLGVEDYVGDYVLDGLNYFGNLRERRDMHITWGMEETKHAAAWHEVLLHSGKRTEKQLSDYRDEVASKSWRFKEQYPFLTPDEPFNIVAFTVWQERATWLNYRNTGLLIRQEYGLPTESTPDERKRDKNKKVKQIGAAGAFKIVGSDELAHYDIFLKLARIYTRYMPETMFDAFVKVFEKGTMPALDLIPDGADLEKAIIETGIHTAREHIEHVRNPIFKALGVKNSRAIARAAQQAKILPPGLGPQYVGVDTNGEFVLSMTPDEDV